MVEAITSVFSNMGTWFVSLFNSLMSIFWVEGTGETSGHLTFVGTLAIIAVAIGLIFGLVSLIRGFLRLRG